MYRDGYTPNPAAAIDILREEDTAPITTEWRDEPANVTGSAFIRAFRQEMQRVENLRIYDLVDADGNLIRPDVRPPF